MHEECKPPLIYNIGVYLSQLDGTVLVNGSIIPNTNIEDHSLVCHIDKQDCCLTSNEGDWYLPDDSVFIATRFDNGTVSLYIKYVPFSTGILRCIVPDTKDNNQTLCIYYGK